MRLPRSQATGASVKRIVVATDRSETADRAVRWAAEMAQRYEGELVIVQVLVGEDGDTAEAEAGLRTFAEHIGAAAAELRVVRDEDPSNGIVRASEEEHADVLVVGNIGMSGRKEFLLGNVPNRVSHNARCTVVIVNTAVEPKKGRFRRSR